MSNPNNDKFIKQAKELGCLSVYSNVDGELSLILHKAPKSIHNEIKQAFKDAALQENFLTEDNDY